MIRKAVCSIILLGLLCSAAQGSGKPNIIYINADDLGVMDVGFMGNTVYHTPNLDQLAREGMVFSEAYAPAANCAPSRAACLSGQAAPRTGVYTVGSSERGDPETRKLIPVKNTLHLAHDVVTVADELKAAGYVTCSVGKWHVGKDPTKQGIDVNIGGGHWGHPKSYFSPYKNPKLSDGPKGEYLTDRLTDEAIRFIGRHKDVPFFLYFPYYTVHTPLQGRKDLVEKYRGMAGVNANYAAMVEALDENVGRLLNSLKQMGLAENTLVLFTSDNGGIRNISKQDPWRAGKGSYYEGGVRVPLTVRWPGKIQPGSTCDVPVSGLDYYPTFLEAVGAERSPGKELDGVSLFPLLTQTGSLPERAFFWHFPIYLQKYGEDDQARDPLFRTRPGSTMRFGRWKLHEYFEDAAFELYDLEADTGERNNLAYAKPEKLDELKKMLNTWRVEINAPVPDQLNPKYKPAVNKKAVSAAVKPNVLIIYADDIGRGDLSCWGQTHFKTPNIDRLAGQGMRFEHFYGCTVCAPARACLLTGNTNSRSPIPNKGGLECKLAAGLISQKEFEAGVKNRRSQRPGNYFMGQMAKSAGYSTAYFGKLGIGYTETADLIESYGFDHHCGLYDSVICWGFYPQYYWENGKMVQLPTNPKFDRATPHCPLVGKEEMVYSEDVWLAECKKYLTERAKDKKPFLAIYATQLPHGPASIAPKDYRYQDRTDWTPRERVYASMMEKLDRSVGELLTELDQLDMAENTVVIFMGDNGHEPDSYVKHDPAGFFNGFWDGHQRGEDRFDGTLGQRGVKRSSHEGGVNVPFMIRWPGYIEPESKSTRRTAVYDVLPTLAEIIDVDIPVEIEGLSFLPTLTGKGTQQDHEALCWINTTGAFRETIIAGDWKLVMELDRKKSDKQARRRIYRPALYNLKEDPREQNDLSQEMPERVGRLTKMINDWENKED